QAMAWTLMDLNITRNTERGTLARRSPRLFRVPRSDFRVFVVPFLPMSYDTLLFETRDAVAFITINRPDKLNALNDQVVDELSHAAERVATEDGIKGDRKSTRLNSSHVSISYAVFCLKKKNKNQ